MVRPLILKISLCEIKGKTNDLPIIGYVETVSVIFEYFNTIRGRRSRDFMVVGFTTTCANSAYQH